jgi:hypothetical protein
MVDENIPVEKTDLEKLKASNDEFEKELIRAREQKAEKQKLEAEALIGGTSGGHIEATPAPVETPKEYADRVMKGEVKAQ